MTRPPENNDKRLETILETVGEGVLVLSSAGVIVECNTAAARLFGRSVDQLQRTWIFDSGWAFLQEDGSPLAMERHPFSKVLRTGQPIRNEILALQAKPAGKTLSERPPPCWLLAHATALRSGPADKIDKVVCALTDITEHRKTLGFLRQSEGKHRGLLESLPVVVIQSNLESEVVYANPATKAITGYDHAEFRTPALWSALIHPEDLPAVRAALEKAKTGATERLEMRYRAKDGTQKIGYCIVQPYRHDDRIEGTITLVMDVTRERRLEEELSRAQRMELVGRLSSGIAHDFNNMLTVMLTVTDFVKAKLPADHDAHQDLETLTGAGQQAAHLARQLLAFGKQQPVQFQAVAINQVIQRALELLRATWALNSEIECSLDSREPRVWGDAAQLQQVLINLFLNARDAMPQGGKLTVKTLTRRGPRRQSEERLPGLMDASGPDQGSRRAQAMWLLLSVQDTGKGMDEGLHARIFEPFFTTKEHGTGLGLAVVQQILASHGGWIEVASRPGQGTRFDIMLPCMDNGRSAGEADSGHRHGEVQSGIAGGNPH
ncbi:MAG: ATP-binding protein [Gemmataceae bacterium]